MKGVQRRRIPSDVINEVGKRLEKTFGLLLRNIEYLQKQ
jgi:hypothetical protein